MCPTIAHIFDPRTTSVDAHHSPDDERRNDYNGDQQQNCGNDSNKDDNTAPANTSDSETTTQTTTPNANTTTVSTTVCFTLTASTLASTPGMKWDAVTTTTTFPTPRPRPIPPPTTSLYVLTNPTGRELYVLIDCCMLFIVGIVLNLYFPIFSLSCFA